MRPYRREDFETLYRLDVACFTPPFRFSRGMMRQVLGARNSLTLVACEGEPEASTTQTDVLGFCALSLERTSAGIEAYIATLDVAPLQQRRGIGRLLLRSAEEVLRPKGISALVLHVFVGNGAALALYGALAFERVSLVQDFYGAGRDAFYLRRELTGTTEPATAVTTAKTI